MNISRESEYSSKWGRKTPSMQSIHLSSKKKRRTKKARRMVQMTRFVYMKNEYISRERVQFKVGAKNPKYAEHTLVIEKKRRTKKARRMVQMTRFELARVAPLEPESSVSAIPPHLHDTSIVAEKCILVYWFRINLIILFVFFYIYVTLFK